jgi:hypothetical protein
VVVADEFLIRLNAKVGDTLRLGGHSFRIAARLVQEPDRITAGSGIGAAGADFARRAGGDGAAGGGEPGE